MSIVLTIFHPKGVAKMKSGMQVLLASAVAWVVLPALAEINTVTLTQGDGSYANSSFAAAGNWSNGLAPVAPAEGDAVTNHYLVALGSAPENALWIPGWGTNARTYFAGERLTIGTDDTEGAMVFGDNQGKVFFPDLVLHSGAIYMQGRTYLSYGLEAAAPAALVEATAEKPFRLIAGGQGTTPLSTMVKIKGAEDSCVLVTPDSDAKCAVCIDIRGADYLGQLIFDAADGALASMVPNIGNNRASARSDAVVVRNGATFFFNNNANGQQWFYANNGGWIVDEHGTSMRNSAGGNSAHASIYFASSTYNVETKGPFRFDNDDTGCLLERGFILGGESNNCSGSFANPDGQLELVAGTNTLLSVIDLYTIPDGSKFIVETNATLAVSASRMANNQLVVNGGFLHLGTYGLYRGVHTCSADNPAACASVHPGISQATYAEKGLRVEYYRHPRPNPINSIGSIDEATISNSTLHNPGFKCEIKVANDTCLADCFTIDPSSTLTGTIKLHTTVAIPLTNDLSKTGWTLLKVPTSVRTLKETDFDLSTIGFDTAEAVDPDGIYSPAVRLETVDGMQHVVLYRKRSANPTLIFLR
ncbi:MAG: hypothetical protein ACI4X9_03080, partial [Kiritimatiellia bacterium]